MVGFTVPVTVVDLDLDLSGSVWICLDLSGSVWICLDLSGSVWICLDLSSNVQIVPCEGLKVTESPDALWQGECTLVASVQVHSRHCEYHLIESCTVLHQQQVM